jgi:hypothetical protein
VADPDVEWEQRRLCADGGCIGVAGPDGRCKVCGKLVPDAGGPFRASPLDVAGDQDEDEDYDGDGDGEGGDGEGDLADAAEVKVAIVEGAAAAEDFADERELCPDGACIGLIGTDGSCKVCGKRRA